MATPDQKLFVLFGPLVKRITSIENYDNSLIPDLQGKAFKELDEVEVYKIPPADTIPFINNFIDRIYDITNDLQALEEKIFHNLLLSLKIGRGETQKNVSKLAQKADEDQLYKQTQSIRYGFEIELNNLIENLLKLLEGLEKYQTLTESAIVTDGLSEIPDRLRFNLTIEELIGMVKIMLECEVISKAKRSEIKPIVRKHFVSKNGQIIGDTSFERHMSPTVPTLSILEDKFLAMYKKCNTLKKRKK